MSLRDRASTNGMNRHPANIPGRSRLAAMAPSGTAPPRPPPCGPEPDPVESPFGFLKGNFPANRVFAAVDDVPTVIGNAWNTLLQDADKVPSVTSRTRAENLATTPQSIP